MKRDNIKSFCKYIWQTKAQTIDSKCPGGIKKSAETKHLTTVTASMKGFLQSRSYKECLITLFETTSLTPKHNLLGMSIYSKVCDAVIHAASQVRRHHLPSAEEAPTDITEAGEKVIRHLAGRAISMERK